MIDSLISYIRKFVDLTDHEISILESKATCRKYLKGQFIVQQGDLCLFESFVIKGCVKTFHIDAEGNQHIVRFAIENWWTADMGSFVSKSPADYNVQCLEDTEVIQFSHETLEELYLQIPALERFFRIIIQRAFIASEKRIIQNFTKQAKDRYKGFRKQYPEIEQRVPQYLIASYLGISKEFLSKIRNELANE